jgi:hypothetical protein
MEYSEVWEMVTFIGGILVLLVLIELFDLPDWIRNHLKKGSTRASIETKVEALEMKVQELEIKVKRLSE